MRSAVVLESCTDAQHMQTGYEETPSSLHAHAYLPQSRRHWWLPQSERGRAATTT